MIRVRIVAHGVKDELGVILRRGDTVRMSEALAGRLVSQNKAIRVYGPTHRKIARPSRFKER